MILLLTTTSKFRDRGTQYPRFNKAMALVESSSQLPWHTNLKHGGALNRLTTKAAD